MKLAAKPATLPKVSKSYAEMRNAIFDNTEENTVIDLEARYDAVVNLSKRNRKLGLAVEDALMEFEDRFPHLLDWDTLKSALPMSLELPITDIWINSTLQRIPSLEAIERYIINFKGVRVQPIKVYLDPNTGKYVCWDGQHTVIMLYLIITRALGITNPKDCCIPVIISRGTAISEMRGALMSENGEGRTLFDDVDMFEQYVYAVRHDGSDKESYLVAEYKQQCLEENDLFLANPRRHESKEAGAITRTEELLNEKFHHEVTKYFAQYAKYVNGSNRPFGGVEVAALYYFLQRCYDTEGMDIDKRYIRSVAKALQAVRGDDFDGDAFWNRVKLSYRNWFDAKELSKPEADRIKISENGDKNEKLLTFICATLESQGIETPDYTPYWPVNKKDLF